MIEEKIRKIDNFVQEKHKAGFFIVIAIFIVFVVALLVLAGMKVL